MSLPPPTTSSIALVTGASAGIGAAIAAELAGRGYGLVLVARRKPRLQEIADELAGNTASALKRSPVTSPSRLRAADCRGASPTSGSTSRSSSTTPGFATNGAFHESDPERELEQVRVLVEAVVALSSAFIPAMVDRGRGAVLNVASTAAMQPLPYSAGYSAAKAYVLTFSEALHQELHGRGITVTALCPGPVSTDFWQISGLGGAGRQDVRAGGPASLPGSPPRTLRAPVSAGSQPGAAWSCPGSRSAPRWRPLATSPTRSSCPRSSG